VNPYEQLGLASVDSDLTRLEVVLEESVIFGDAYLDTVTTHLIRAGGKRLRPLLAIASATGGERPATKNDLLGAVSLELMHLASLYHDDVMDEAEIRRDVESVNARYGNLIAIVAGDYLMARSA
jgi:heptaprenyl diphosphate synthase